MKNLKILFQYLIGSGALLIIGIISTPIITRVINPEQLGKFSFFNTMISFLQVICLMGLDQAYSRFYDEYTTKKENLFLFCTKIPIIAGIIFSIFIILFNQKVSLFLVEENSILVAILFSANVLLMILTTMHNLEIRMQQNAKLYSFVNFALKLFYLVFVLLFYSFYGDTYLTNIYALSVTNLIIFIFLFIRKNVRLNKNKKCIKLSKKEKVQIFKYSLPLLFTMAIDWLLTSMDKLSIRQYAGYNQIGIYSGAQNIATIGQSIYSAFSVFWFPFAYKFYKKENEKKIYLLFHCATLIGLICMCFVVLFKHFLIMFLGSSYHSAINIFPFLIYVPVLKFISDFSVVQINLENKTYFHLWVSIIACTCNFICNFLFVPRIGALGAAIATCLAYIVFLIIRFVFCNKKTILDFKLKRLLISVFTVLMLLLITSIYSNLIVDFLLPIAIILLFCLLYKKELFNIIKLLRGIKLDV